MAAVFSPDSLKPDVLEYPLGHLSHTFLVLHDEDRAAAAPLAPLSGRLLRGGYGSSHRREEHPEGCPPPGLGPDPDQAAVAAHDSHHGGETQPAAGKLGGEERVEDARQRVRA